MISRQSLTAAALGLVSGLVGAVVATRFFAERPAPQAAPFAPRGAIIPPGWDPRITDQVAALERRVGATEVELAERRDRQPTAAPQPASVPASAGEQMPSKRERERLDSYRRELETMATFVQEHDAEPFDAGWSRQVAASIQDQLSLGGKERSFGVRSVDCRTKTCVATLTFPSPAEALEFVARADARVPVADCKGTTITPPPPTGEGSYDLPILYMCR